MKGFAIFLFAMLLGLAIGHGVGFVRGRNNHIGSLVPDDRTVKRLKKACWWVSSHAIVSRVAYARMANESDVTPLEMVAQLFENCANDFGETPDQYVARLRTEAPALLSVDFGPDDLSNFPPKPPSQQDCVTCAIAILEER